MFKYIKNLYYKIRFRNFKENYEYITKYLYVKSTKEYYDYFKNYLDVNSNQEFRENVLKMNENYIY